MCVCVGGHVCMDVLLVGVSTCEMKVSADLEAVVVYVSCHCKVSLGPPIGHPWTIHKLHIVNISPLMPFCSASYTAA